MAWESLFSGDWNLKALSYWICYKLEKCGTHRKGKIREGEQYQHVGNIYLAPLETFHDRIRCNHGYDFGLQHVTVYVYCWQSISSGLTVYRQNLPLYAFLAKGIATKSQ